MISEPDLKKVEKLGTTVSFLRFCSILVEYQRITHTDLNYPFNFASFKNPIISHNAL